MKDDSGKTLNGNAYKHPIFDGEDPNEFKSWWDNVNATLEMEDLEEYITLPYELIALPTKESGETDSTEAVAVALAKKNKLIRKEMKKAKAHMVKVTKDFPKRLVMDATTPYEAYAALKTKYSVAKNRQDFVRLDREWNEFKVTDEKADPDKIFATLDEHSKKIAEFGKRNEKDSLQILSKLETAMPPSYEHVFTLLNMDEEYKKAKDAQLVTAKRMIKAHFESHVKTLESGKDGSMMCMFIGKDGSDTSKKGTYKCDHNQGLLQFGLSSNLAHSLLGSHISRNRLVAAQLDGRVLAQMGSSDHFRILGVVYRTYLFSLSGRLGLAVGECAGALLFAQRRQLLLPS